MVRRTFNILLITGLLFLAERAEGQQPALYSVTKLPFNSGYYNEISPVIVKDGVIFCSDRRYSGIKDRTAFDGRRLYNFYFAEKIDTSEFKSELEIKSERSTRFNNGPFCIAADGKTVYFTSEVETGRQTRNRKFRNYSGIFIGELNGDQLTGVRPFKYNSTTYDVGHPSISSDGKTLYFASNMPGGQGKSDIYYCEFINNDWSEPVNPGPVINSSSSENYPAISSGGKLFFTSDRSGGFGRMDIYSTYRYEGKWEKASIMPEPVNSASDDFAFVAEAGHQRGYFTSNRDRGDDIFSFSSLIRRMDVCDTLQENSYCYRFTEENAAKLDTTPFRYEWKFGDGQKAIGAVVEHCYSGPGSYLVQLDVINLITKEVLYNEKSDSLIITDIEQPYITAPDEIQAGKAVNLNADRTYLPGWNISRYYWNFGDETIQVGKEVDKTYLKPGTYNIQLIVSEETSPGMEPRERCICKNIKVISQP